MAEVTKKIGLSLGADICWAACYEEILRRLDLKLPIGSDVVQFATDRVRIEPFSMRQPVNYDLVIDRLTHWMTTTREWVKKAVIMDGLYVLNNPWAIQSMEKHTTYCAMAKLGLPVPETWMLPPKVPSEHADMKVTLQRYANLFDLKGIGDQLGYPSFIKPYDGGGWVGVSRVDNSATLAKTYEESGDRVMHLQKAVEPFDLFVRTIGIGPQVHVVKYDPTAPLHARYTVEFFFVNGDEWSLLSDQMLTINGFFNWEFNSCESLRKDGVFYPIDFANACPDFQVTSLHYHFPILVKNMLRWSIFCAATGRKMQPNLDWQPYFDVAAKDIPYRERLAGYANVTKQRYELEKFREFCATHLSHLDEVALEFFGTEQAKSIVRQKVTALYPPHEIEKFTDHFFGLVQFWRKTESDRLNKGNAE